MSKNGRVQWDDYERQSVIDDAYHELAEDPTRDLLAIVKKVAANVGPGKNRNINTLTSVSWLVRGIKAAHTKREKIIWNTHNDLRNLQAKPKTVEMTPEQRAREMPTWLLLMELVRRGDERLRKMESAVKKGY